jgi:cytochrome-b5 reductase
MHFDGRKKMQISRASPGLLGRIGQMNARWAALLPLSLTAWYVSRRGTLSGSMANPDPLVEPYVPSGFHPYTVVQKSVISPDSAILRFKLPPSQPTVGLPLPSCLKITHDFPNNDVNAEFPNPTITLDKSYSPISLPDAEGHFDLLVKGYEPRQGGGLGRYLTDLNVGDTALAKMKAPRIIHGDIYRPGRWSKIGFVAAGTGIAPHLQMIRAVLADPVDAAELSLIFANRNEDDILMRAELDGYKTAGTVNVRHVLSKPPANWNGSSGWVTVDDVRQGLPPPGPGVLILVCGRDGFVETVSGMTVRGDPPPGKKKGPKLQGPVTGLLKEAGYTEEMVYKF